VVKFFAKCLAHDGTLERCVPLVSQRHTLLSRALNLPIIQFVVLNDRFQYSDLEAPGCLLIHLTNDISHLIKLSFNTPKSTRGLDALSRIFP
jgi:hypothetical protein